MKITNINLGQCEMSAKLFVLSCKRGYDSKDFIEKLLRSDLAKHMYQGESSVIWLGEEYLLQTLEVETSILKGEVLPCDFMEWAGYLYRVWSIDYPEDSPQDMLQQAPCEVLQQAYLGFHVMSFEMAIEDLKAVYNEKQH